MFPDIDTIYQLMFKLILEFAFIIKIKIEKKNDLGDFP